MSPPFNLVEAGGLSYTGGVSMRIYFTGVPVGSTPLMCGVREIAHPTPALAVCHPGYYLLGFRACGWPPKFPPKRRRARDAQRWAENRRFWLKIFDFGCESSIWAEKRRFWPRIVDFIRESSILLENR